MGRYIYQSPKECSRALTLIMEQTDKDSETHNVLKTAIGYLFTLQMECDDEQKEIAAEKERWEKECERKRCKKGPIVVGDEIIIYDDLEISKVMATVIDIDRDGALWILDETGANTIIDPHDGRKREKTGRHFDYIADLIHSMKVGATE